MRRSGVLMHITSLPSPGGVGTLGREAFAFADFMEKAGLSVWQMLPIALPAMGNPLTSPAPRTRATPC